MIGLILLAAAASTNTTTDTLPRERSAAEMICTLSGDCGGAIGGARQPRPKEAAFQLDGIADRSLEVQFAKIRAARARAAAAERSAQSRQ